MRKRLLLVLTFCSALAFAGEIIPVNKWPRVIKLPEKVVVNPTVDQCVEYGYRLLTPKPKTPAGKRIKSEAIIQDPDDKTKCKYDIVYEDIPVPPAPEPEVTTNVPADEVRFTFTTNGAYWGATWINAPGTN